MIAAPRRSSTMEDTVSFVTASSENNASIVEAARSHVERQVPVTPPTPLSPSGYAMSAYTNLPDLTVPDEFTDIALVVEDQKLYTCKGILASASSVWRRMFISDFKERDAKELSLPGKNFRDMEELLLCISPAIQKPVSDENVFAILPLADEYQIAKLKHDCENWLMSQVHMASQQEDKVRCLVTASRYNLDRLLQYTLDLVASSLQLEQLDSVASKEGGGIDQNTMMQILRRRTEVLEVTNDKLTANVSSWKSKCESNEDCLKKMGREKLTIKRALDEIEGAWDMKGSDARCIDPVHIYGPRNFSCDKCSRQVHTYIQSKVWFLLNRGSTWSGINWPQ